MKTATWVNKSKKITGRWLYNWAGDYFVIHLDSVDRITGQERQFRAYGDKPEWDNWKLVR